MSVISNAEVRVGFRKKGEADASIFRDVGVKDGASEVEFGLIIGVLRGDGHRNLKITIFIQSLGRGKDNNQSKRTIPLHLNTNLPLPERESIHLLQLTHHLPSSIRINLLVLLSHTSKVGAAGREFSDRLGTNWPESIGALLRNEGVSASELGRVMVLSLLSCLLLLLSLLVSLLSSFAESGKKSLAGGHLLWLLLLLFLLLLFLLLLLLLWPSDRNIDLRRSHKMPGSIGGHISRLNLRNGVDNHLDLWMIVVGKQKTCHTTGGYIFFTAIEFQLIHFLVVLSLCSEIIIYGN